MPRIMRPSHYTSKPSFRMLPEDYARVKGGRPKRKDQMAFGIIFLVAIVLLTLALIIGWQPMICIPLSVIVVAIVLLAHHKGWLYG